jgi:hypothetical protein
LICILLVYAFGDLRGRGERAAPTLDDPLASAAPGCRLSGEAALQRARQLEALADASWERLPFDDGEAPDAVLQIAEAEACFRAAFEREGRQRCELKRRSYGAELARRWSRARLYLELAQRRSDAPGVRVQVRRLLALSRRSGVHGADYRRWLEQVDRAALAELASAQPKRGGR